MTLGADMLHAAATRAEACCGHTAKEICKALGPSSDTSENPRPAFF